MIREKKYVTGVNINNMRAFEIIRYFTSISLKKKSKQNHVNKKIKTEMA
tara:strand:+ start:721 stop:867 length:147 start_codon:yes stop_codon:yes gene_type:complete